MNPVACWMDRSAKAGRLSGMPTPIPQAGAGLRGRTPRFLSFAPDEVIMSKWIERLKRALGLDDRSLSRAPRRRGVRLRLETLEDRVTPAAPVITIDHSVLAYTEDTPTENVAIVIDSALTVTDADSTNLVGATVQITGNHAPLGGRPLLQLRRLAQWSDGDVQRGDRRVGLRRRSPQCPAMRRCCGRCVTRTPATRRTRWTGQSPSRSMTGTDTGMDGRAISVTASNDAPILYAAGPRLVSITAGGTLGNNASDFSSISGDGRYVAFSSTASNLVIGDNNTSRDVFVKDLVTGTITLVSTDAAGAQGNDASGGPLSISSDGRYVAFTSAATNLVPGNPFRSFGDIYVKDLVTGAITRASTAADGTLGNGNPSLPSISSDGRYVSFTSNATNLVADDTNFQDDIFVKDLATGTIIRASTDAAGTQANGGSPYSSSISSDGRYVAFTSNATNLVPGVDNNNSPDVFVKDLTTGTITRISSDAGGALGNKSSLAPSMSSDGRYVAFYSNSNKSGGRRYQR